jgi:glycosyltransferase involved in cell wall biosynthesis
VPARSWVLRFKYRRLEFEEEGTTCGQRISRYGNALMLNPAIRHSGAPLISVGMPAYNAEPYIGAAIESVLGQTLQDWELIVVNDGSTDATLERIRSYSDPRIRCFSQDNSGPAVGYNRALAESRGRFFALLNADDVCYPDRLAYQSESYSRGGRRILFSAPDFIDAEGRQISDAHFLTGRFWADSHARTQTLERFFFHGNFLCTPTLFAEREVLLEAGSFNPALFNLNDFDLWIRLVKKYALCPDAKAILHYRIHPNNLSGPPREPADLRRAVRFQNENYLVMRNFFDGVPPALFKEAFGDRLIRPTCETDLERECEQAFLYLKMPDRRIQLIGMENLGRLLADPQSERALKEFYGFTPLSFANGPLADIDIENLMPKE